MKLGRGSAENGADPAFRTCRRGFPDWRRALQLFAVALAAVCGVSVGDAEAAPLRRDVLALYDATREPEPRATRLHRFVELPLNHLGYRLTYWDISRGLPDGRLTDTAAAVISWFDAPVAVPGFAEWCGRQATVAPGQLKWIVFGSPGVALDDPGSAARDACLALIGLKLQRSEVRLGAFAHTVDVDAAMIPDTGGLLLPPGTYPELRATAGALSHLSVAPAAGDPSRVDFIVTGPSSGYVSEVAALIADPRLPAPIWRLDIFAFLKTVLAGAPHPVPDVTTALGRRLFFATVGPEGWLSRLPAIRFGETPVLASEILVTLLRDDFPDLPASVAVISGDLAGASAGRAAEAGRAAAAAIFTLPQVEIASAGSTGIETWSFFEQFDSAREAAALSAADPSDQRTDRGLLWNAVDRLSTILLSGRAAQAGRSAELPRRYIAGPFSLEDEIAGGIAAATALAPPGRRAALFMWSGDAMPFAAAMAMPGVPTLGGGGGAITRAAPSVAGLWPYSAPVGGGLQIYHALSGVVGHGSHVSGDPLAFQMLLQTLEATEWPARLKPFQVAFSAGDMARFGTRQAIQRMLQHAQDDEVLPIPASGYVRIVEGFATAGIVPEGELRWRIMDRGALATVRFDSAGDLALDLDASTGALGARRKGTTLYISLDPADQSPLVVLARSGAASGVVARSWLPSIESSRWWISGLTIRDCAVRFTAQGFGPGEISIITAPGLVMNVDMARAAAPDRPVFRTAASATAEGRLAFTLPAIPPGESAVVSLAGSCGS